MVDSGESSVSQVMVPMEFLRGLGPKSRRVIPTVRPISVNVNCSDHCSSGCDPNCSKHWTCCHCGSGVSLIQFMGLINRSTALKCATCSHITHHCVNGHNKNYCKRCNAVSKTFSYGEQFQCHYCNSNVSTPHQMQAQD